MCIPSPNDLSTKDPLAFQSLSKPVNEFKRGQSVCVLGELREMALSYMFLDLFQSYRMESVCAGAA